MRTDIPQSRISTLCPRRPPNSASSTPRNRSRPVRHEIGVKMFYENGGLRRKTLGGENVGRANF
jgi:hypothetical protein